MTSAGAGQVASRRQKGEQRLDLVKSLLGLVLVFSLVAGPVLAQPAVQEKLTSAADVDKLQGDLAAIEKSLDRQHIADAELQELRKQIDPIATAARDAADALAPRLALIQARLDQLGPKPDEKAQASAAPPEAPAVAAERVDQQKAFSETEDLVKRAGLVALKAEQAGASITARRRALFAKSLFEQVASITSPRLWTDVWREVPRHAQAVAAAFREWLDGVNGRLDGWRLPAFWSSLGLIIAVTFGVPWLSRRVLSRDPTQAAPSRLQKCLGAWWVALSFVVPALAAVALIRLDTWFFELSYSQLTPFWAAAAIGVLRIALIAGLIRGLLAPSRPNWRLLDRTDPEATRTFGLAVTIVSVISVTRLLEALNDIVGVSLAFSVATRVLHAVTVAGILCVGLWRLTGRVSDQSCLGPPVTRQRDWFSLFHLAAWPVTLAILVAVLIGYVTFANFLVDQLVFIGVTLCVLFMSTTLLEEGIGAVVAPANPFGNRLRTSLGLGQSGFVLLGVVVSGIVRLALYALAVLLVVAPWGLQSSDVSFDVAAAFFGFKVGDISISPVSIVVAIGIFTLIYALGRSALGWLDKSLLPHTGLDVGLRNSIRTSLGYLSFVTAATLALGYLGLGFDKLALVAGGLSVGIGLGLQSIVNNFVSGLVLLWERAVRVGDWIVVGSDQGFVRRINVRATEIETFDRSQVVIPNSSLITGVVKNLVRNDRTGRIVIPISVAGSADPEQVRAALFAIAKAHELVLKFPAPQILFTSMSASALSFELLAFVTDVESATRVRSDLHFEIFKQFKAEGFFVAPGPDPTKVEITGLDDFAARLGPRIELATEPVQRVPPRRRPEAAEAGASAGRTEDA
jgi:small-conductance mechanosensitive channel